MQTPLAALAALSLAAPAAGQFTLAAPQLTRLEPCGVRAGTSAEVTVTGEHLGRPDRLVFSHPGLKAERLPDPPTPGPKNKKRKPKPPPPVRFRVTAAADLPAGVHDCRAVGPNGVSNPRAFRVTPLTQQGETEPNNDVPEAQKVALETVTDGDIAGRTDVDFFRFAARKGQTVVVRCRAASVDSRLTADLRVFDAADRLLATGIDHEGDSVIPFAVPAGGEYVVRLCSLAYQQGGPDCFYRLEVTTGPWLRTAFPPAVTAGRSGEVRLVGANLPAGGVADLPAADRSDLTRFPALLPPTAATLGLTDHGPLRIALTDTPPAVAAGKNRSPKAALRVAVPGWACGRLAESRRRDWYRFTAKKGERLIIEVAADRLGTPADLAMYLFRAADMKLLGEYDEHREVPTAAGHFFTHTEDPTADFTAKQDGDYLLAVGPRAADASLPAALVYAIQWRRPSPDFTLVAVENPTTEGGGAVVGRGGVAFFRVFCPRRDGFAGPVSLTVEGLPPGVTCPPQALPPLATDTVLAVYADEKAADWAGPVRVVGTAVVDGQERRKVAVPGCQLWPTQNNGTSPSRLTRGLWLSVRPPRPYRMVMEYPPHAAAGSQFPIKFKLITNDPKWKTQVQLTQATAPLGRNRRPVRLPTVKLTPGKQATANVRLPRDAVPGVHPIAYFGQAQINVTDPKTKRRRRFTVTQPLPPAHIKIYDRFAEVTPEPAAVTLKPGVNRTITVRVKRLYGYAGDIEMYIMPPRGHRTVSASRVKLSAKATEAKMELRPRRDSKPVNRAEYRLRCSGRDKGVSLQWEVPLPITVTK